MSMTALYRWFARLAKARLTVLFTDEAFPVSAAGEPFVIASAIASRFSPLNGGCPVSISCSTTPSDQMSV